MPVAVYRDTTSYEITRLPDTTSVTFTSAFDKALSRKFLAASMTALLLALMAAAQLPETEVRREIELTKLRVGAWVGIGVKG
jgi:YbbR domain-containing protein